MVSPLWETMHAIRVIVEPQRHQYHLPWLEAVRPEAERLDLRPLLMLSPRRGWTPDFLSPVPDRPVADVPAELARVRATPPEQVAHEVRRSLTERSGAPVPPGAWRLLDDPAATRDLVADLLAQSWELLVAAALAAAARVPGHGRGLPDSDPGRLRAGAGPRRPASRGRAGPAMPSSSRASGRAAAC